MTTKHAKSKKEKQSKVIRCWERRVHRPLVIPGYPQQLLMKLIIIRNPAIEER